MDSHLDDAALWQAAGEAPSPEEQKELSLLLEKNKLGSLTHSEESKLNKLCEEADGCLGKPKLTSFLSNVVINCQL